MSEEEIINIIALKQRAEEMLKNDYSRKIGDEEIYTIICEWEKTLDLYNKEKEKNAKLLDEAIVTYFDDEELKKSIANYLEKLLKKNIQKDYISKEKIRDLIVERKFELQQEYKDFEDDIKLNTLEELLEE